MTARQRIFLASILGVTFLAAAAARAEKTFPVNDTNGLFDQPSVAMFGAAAHVAFIGDTTGTGYKVHYAVVNGAADFTNVALARSAVLLTPPTEVADTEGSPDNTYADARHPKIVMRSATEAVIFFQAKRSSPSDPYELYRARVVLDNNAVVKRYVQRIGVNVAPGDSIEDVSFAIVAADNTARVVYSNRTASTVPFNLSFARVGLDNAQAASPVAITSSYPLSQGFRPIPNLKLDDLNRAHIAWAATDASGTAPGPVYYAMIKETNGVDNMVIAPSQIMTGRGVARYSFPNLLVFGHSSITVIASDEDQGDLAYVQLNPDAARQNGLPAWDNLATNNSFLLVPPGEVILPAEFRLFRPDAFYEAASGRILMTGYGSGGANNTAGATFLALKLNGASADLVTAATPFAMQEIPSGLDNDYTQAAFGFPGGKVVVFWSGKVAGSSDRNLDVTTVPTVAAWITHTESGCAMVPDPAFGAGGRIPGSLLLFLPAAVLAGRRILVNRGKRPAPRGKAPGARRPAWRTIGR